MIDKSKFDVLYDGTMKAEHGMVRTAKELQCFAGCRLGAAKKITVGILPEAVAFWDAVLAVQANNEKLRKLRGGE